MGRFGRLGATLLLGTRLPELSHEEEATMYRTNHYAWCQYIAPRWVVMMKAATVSEKRELWNIAPHDLRDEIRRLAKT